MFSQYFGYKVTNLMDTLTLSLNFFIGKHTPSSERRLHAYLLTSTHSLDYLLHIINFVINSSRIL